MYEHLKFREIADKLEPETLEMLRRRWPEIDDTRYAARDIIRKMDVKTLSDLYKIGLNINCACLTVLTAEMLIRYDVDYRYHSYSDDTNTSVIKNIVVKYLQKAFDEHRIMMGGTLVNTLGFTFFAKCQEYDYLLAKYGLELSRGLIFMGPEDWLKEALKHSRRAPLVARKIPWANALLET